MSEKQPSEADQRFAAEMVEYVKVMGLNDDEWAFVAKVSKSLQPKSVYEKWRNARLAGGDLRPLAIKAVFAVLLFGAEQIVRDLEGRSQSGPIN